MKAMIYNQDKLKDLLSRFVDEELLTNEIIIIANDYLFNHSDSVPFFRHTELYDTVVYLKDVIERNQLTGVEDIVRYYDQKKLAFRRFFTERYKENVKPSCQVRYVSDRTVLPVCPVKFEAVEADPDLLPAVRMSQSGAMMVGLTVAAAHICSFYFAAVENIRGDNWSVSNGPACAQSACSENWREKAL